MTGDFSGTPCRQWEACGRGKSRDVETKGHSREHCYGLRLQAFARASARLRMYPAAACGLACSGHCGKPHDGGQAAKKSMRQCRKALARASPSSAAGYMLASPCVLNACKLQPTQCPRLCPFCLYIRGTFLARMPPIAGMAFPRSPQSLTVNCQKC